MARPGGVEPPWIFLPVVLDPFRQHLLPLALRLMTRRHQHERRMIPISLDHPIRLFVEHLLHRTSGTNVVPHTWLDLKVKTEFVGSFESSFGRDPGMKPHVIQAPTLTGLKNFFPGSYIWRRITGEREVAAVVSTSKDDGSAIEHEFFSNCPQFTQSNLQFVILVNVSSP